MKRWKFGKRVGKLEMGKDLVRRKGEKVDWWNDGQFKKVDSKNVGWWKGDKIKGGSVERWKA